MKHSVLSTLVLAGLLVLGSMGAKAQKVIGHRDYHAWDGGSRISASAISHYKLFAPTTLYLEPAQLSPVEVGTEVLVMRNPIGVNRFRTSDGIFAYNTLFTFAIESADKTHWDNYMAFSYCRKDSEGKTAAVTHYFLKWSTPQLDLTLPTEADIEYFEYQGQEKTNFKTFHAKVAFAPKSITIGEEEMECVSLFADKLQTKLNGKTMKLYSKYTSNPKSNTNDEIREGHFLVTSLLEE